MKRDLAGYPIGFRGEGERREWLSLLRDSSARPASRSPCLTVEFVRSSSDLPDTSMSRGVLAGDGFALDFRRRILYYPRSLPRTISVGTGRRRHDLLARTIVFALALLAERKGPASVQQASVTRQAPLYLHASAVAGPRGALVFCGNSTFGKSTISGKLLRKWPQLEDDLAMILAGPVGRRTPAPPLLAMFSNKKRGAATGTTPVAGIFWLEKSPEFSLTPMTQAEAASLLLPPVANWGHPPAAKNRLRLLRALLSAVPCQRLRFRAESAPLHRLLHEHGYV